MSTLTQDTANKATDVVGKGAEEVQAVQQVSGGVCCCVAFHLTRNTNTAVFASPG